MTLLPSYPDWWKVATLPPKFHCRRKSDDKLFQFYAGTGKIQGYDRARGIHALIKILEG